MTINLKAMQIAQTMAADNTKVRVKPADVKPRYMVGGSWLSNLSKGCVPSRKLKGRSIE